MVARLSMLRLTARLPMDAAIALDMWSGFLPLSTTTGLCALSSVSSCDTCASSAQRCCRSASTASFALDASESAAESPLSAGRVAISAMAARASIPAWMSSPLNTVCTMASTGGPRWSSCIPRSSCWMRACIAASCTCRCRIMPPMADENSPCSPSSGVPASVVCMPAVATVVCAPALDAPAPAPAPGLDAIVSCGCQAKRLGILEFVTTRLDP